MRDVISKDSHLTLSKDEELIPDYASDLDYSDLEKIKDSSSFWDKEIWGNAILLMIATVGSTFFYMPYHARQIGLLSTVIMLLVSAGFSYGCSIILLMGFQYTKAKTYNECMEKVLGSKIGAFSSFVMLLHTIGKVMSTWIFSFDFISVGMTEIFGISPDKWYMKHLNLIFFSVCLCILLVSIAIKSIQKLQFVSFVGLLLMGYLLSVFVCLTPKYFSYYRAQDKIHPKLIILNGDMLKVWGVANYMFLNQYAVTPMCATLKNFSYSRGSRIISLSTIMALFIYLLLLLVGYFSLPTDSDNQIFLLRPKISDSDDSFIVYGRLIFGFTLLIVVIVRTQFMLIYFEQMSGTISKIFSRQSIFDSQTEGASRPSTSFFKKALFLLAHTILTCIGVKHLNSILGFLGSFVGVFEVIILPCFLFLILNAKSKMISKKKERAFIVICSLGALVSFSAVIASIA